MTPSLYIVHINRQERSEDLGDGGVSVLFMELFYRCENLKLKKNKARDWVGGSHGVRAAEAVREAEAELGMTLGAGCGGRG